MQPLLSLSLLFNAMLCHNFNCHRNKHSWDDHPTAVHETIIQRPSTRRSSNGRPRDDHPTVVQGTMHPAAIQWTGRSSNRRPRDDHPTAVEGMTIQRRSKGPDDLQMVVHGTSSNNRPQDVIQRPSMTRSSNGGPRDDHPTSVHGTII